MKPPPENVRVDRWLSSARFYKTRTQAASACSGGKVKLNGSSAKPHKTVRVGDRITVHVRGRYRNIEVLALAERGLPPAEARKLYHEEKSLVLNPEEEELLALYKKSMKKSRWTKGRPTKKDRRKMDEWRENKTDADG